MATLYAFTGGGNWSDTTATWRTVSSSGSAAGVSPTASDDVIFDASSASTAVVVDTATCVCKSITFQASGNKITFTSGQKLTVSGNVTFFSGQGANVSGTGTLAINALSTIASAAVTFPGSVQLNFAGNITLSAAWTITGSMTIGANVTMVGAFLLTAGSMSIGAFTLTLVNNWTISGALSVSGNATINGVFTLSCAGFTLGATLSGTTNISITGGTWSGNFAVANPITFLGSVTVSGSVAKATSGAIVWSSGVITTTGSTLTISGSVTLNTPTANMSWGNITVSATATVTVSSAITLTGVLNVAAGATMTLATNNITCAGIDTNSTGIIAGNTIVLSGGTWQATGWTTGYVASNITLAGNVTISGNVGFRTGAIVWSSGVITTTGSTINFGANGSLNAASANMHFNNLTCSATSTIALSAVCTFDGVIKALAGATLTTATSAYTCAGIDTTSTGIITGTAITLSGGTWQSTGWTTGYVSSNISLAGTITVSGSIGYRTGTLTWTSGVINTTNSILNIGASCTINTPTANMHWFTITTSAASTITLTAAATLDGNLNSSSGIMTLATSDITVAGSLVSTGGFAGAGRTITMNGNGTTPTWSGAAAVACNLNLNAPGKTVTISGVVYFNTGTLTYTAGTITVAGSTLVIAASSTLDTNTLSWNNITMNGSITALTLSSALNVSANLAFQLSTTLTVSGAFNISCANLFCAPTTANAVLSLLHGQTLNVLTSMNVAGNSNFSLTISSNTAANTFLVYAGTPANCALFNTIFTWVSAAGSAQTLLNFFGGTLTSTTNITNTTGGGGSTSDIFGMF